MSDYRRHRCGRCSVSGACEWTRNAGNRRCCGCRQRVSVRCADDNVRRRFRCTRFLYGIPRNLYGGVRSRSRCTCICVRCTCGEHSGVRRDVRSRRFGVRSARSRVLCACWCVSCECSAIRSACRCTRYAGRHVRCAGLGVRCRCRGVCPPGAHSRARGQAFAHPLARVRSSPPATANRGSAPAGASGPGSSGCRRPCWRRPAPGGAGWRPGG